MVIFSQILFRLVTLSCEVILIYVFSQECSQRLLVINVMKDKGRSREEGEIIIYVLHSSAVTAWRWLDLSPGWC